eukprot:7621369-Ditylum_brightwellii.AAC.1
MDPNVATKELEMIKSYSGKTTIIREILVKDQLQEAIDIYGEDLNNGLSSPSYNDLFTTYNDILMKLDKK